MTTLLNPYINFTDNAHKAMEFYQKVFGGKLEMNSFKEFGMATTPEDENRVMHAQLTTDNGMVLMGSDTPAGMQYEQGSRVTITLSDNDEAELRGYWNALTEGGNITLPLQKSPWNDQFGMLVDKYGVKWMVNINALPA